MKKIIKSGLSIALSAAMIFAPVIGNSSISLAGTYIGAETVLEEQSREIGPSISETEYRLNIGGHSQRAYSLEADPLDQNFVLKSSLALDELNGRETTTDQANRNNRTGNAVVGAVNGDYFDFATGIPIGTMVSDGEVIKTASAWKGYGITASGESMIGTPDFNIRLSHGQEEVGISHVNKNRSADSLILYTHRFGESTKTNPYGTEIVVDIVGGSPKLESSVTGVVESVRANLGDTSIEDGKMVLSAHGIYREVLKNLKVGEQIDISFDAEGNWNNASEIIGGKDILLKDGQITQGLESTKNPRTAIGVKEDGKIFVLAIDGRQPGYSEGVGLNELAGIMKDMGAVDALNLDGGGSTSFASRTPGYDGVTLKNSPSGGYERPVSNSLLFVSTGVSGLLDKIVLNPQELTILAGTSYDIEARGVDKYYNPVPLTDNLSWTVEGNIGSFNNGVYSSTGGSGAGKVYASNGDIRGAMDVEVVDKIDEIRFSQNSYSIEPGEEIELDIYAYRSGQEIVSSHNSFDWTVEGNIGSIDDNGVFKASSSKGLEGKIIASYNGARAEVGVSVGKLPQSIEDFEGDREWEQSGANYNNASIEKVDLIDGEPVYSKNSSLKINYDFEGKTGTSGVYAGPKEDIELSGYPKKVGMWVYGNNSGHWLRAQLRDGDNNAFSIDFTNSSGGVNWNGWKYVEAEIPEGRKTPLKMDLAIRIMETNNDKKDKGQIYIDDIVSVYSSVTGEDYEEQDPPVEEEENHLLTDIGGHWSQSVVEELFNVGIVSGSPTSDGKLVFRPNSNITREEFAKLVVEVNGLTVSDYGNLGDFKDSSEISTWAREYVSTAYREGLIEGSVDKYGNTLFSPKVEITKQEIGTIVGRTLGDGIDQATKFEDDAKVASWARPYVNECVLNRIISGTPENNFEPTKSATRAESAKIIYGLYSLN